MKGPRSKGSKTMEGQFVGIFKSCMLQRQSRSEKGSSGKEVHQLPGRNYTVLHAINDLLITW